MQNHMKRTSNQAPRRLLVGVLITCLLVPMLCLGGAAEGVRFPVGAVDTPVTLNGKRVLEGETARINGVTYVPLRNFCNLFADCSITWNGKTNTATVKTNTLTLIATTGNLYITANGRYLYTVEPILNLSGRLYVPVRPMALAFVTSVTWDAENGVAALTRSGSSVISRAKYSDEDVYWLSRIISAEAQGEPFLGKMAVGNVVLNRVASRDYPNTVRGVIFDRRYGVQFTPTANGMIYRVPTTESVITAKICLEGYTLSDEILFFFNPRIATSSWISKNRPFAFAIGNHRFYR